MKILLILFIFTNLAFAEQGPEKREMPERWYKLNSLINAEIKAIQSITPLSPRLGQRLIELHTEKLELIKKRENQRFLNSSEKQRQKKSKSDFFTESQNLMGKVQSFGLKQIKKFPSYIGNAEIYHTLALNSRDYGNGTQTEVFLQRALKKAPQNSQVIYQIQTSLAEHYYNEKKYQTAINFYDQVLKNESDEWRSKHLFNASWCYLKTQNYQKAISLLINSFKVSERPRMVSMRDQIMQSAGAFFVMGNQVQDGLDFYLKNAEEPTTHLLSMAKRVEESLGFKLTDHVLTTGLKEAKGRNHKTHIIQIQLQRLDTYRSFKKYDMHEKTAQEINGLYKTLKPEESIPGKEDAVYKITELVGYLQIRLSKNANINQVDYDPKLLKKIHNYFNILIDLNPVQKSFYLYYKAESSFAVSEYKQAAIFYKESLEETKKNMDIDQQTDLKMTKEELQKKVLNALLSILEYSNMNKKNLDQLALYTYSNHISLWPIDEKSRLIYKTLFNLLFEKGKYTHAKKTMVLYSQNYKKEKDREIQRSMLTQIIDFRIKNKDANALAAWINKLNKGFLDIEKDYIEKATIILGQLLFESYKSLQDQGLSEKAINGYQKIYEDERYPQKIKADASFYLAEIQVNKGNYAHANEWFSIFHQHASSEEQSQKLSTLYNFHLTYADGQDFENAIILADKLIKRHCQKEFKQKEDLFQNRVYFSYLEEDHKNAYRYINAVEECPLYKNVDKNKEWKDKQLSGLISNYVRTKNWSLFLPYYQKYKNSVEFHLTQSSLNSGLLRLYWDALMRKSKPQVQKSLSLLDEADQSFWTKKQKEEYKSIQIFHQEYPQILEHKVGDFTQHSEFKEEIFNKELENEATRLGEISQKVDRIVATGVPEYMLISASVLNHLYLDLAKKIKDYTPQGVPKEFVQSFKGAMNQVATGLESSALGQFNGIKDSIQKNKSLTAFNYVIYEDQFDSQAFDYQYLASEHVFPLDRMTNTPERKIGQVERGAK